MISDALQELYASAPRGQFAENGVTLTHPAFSQDWHLTNYPVSENPSVEFEAFRAIVDGEIKSFLSHPIDARLPQQGTTGAQQMEISLANSGAVMASEIVNAAQMPEVPINVRVDTFIIGDLSPQDDPFIFEVSTVSVDRQSVTSRAGGNDILNQATPRLRFTRTSNPGLSR